MNAPEPKSGVIAPMIVVAFVLLFFGTCSYTTVSCWHRGGTVMRNIFDWPTCVEITRK